MDQHSTNPKAEELTEIVRLYDTALSIIAHSEIQGYQSEACFKTLKFLQDCRDAVKAQLKAVSPPKPADDMDGIPDELMPQPIEGE